MHNHWRRCWRLGCWILWPGIATALARPGDTLLLQSPSGRISVRIWTDPQIRYGVTFDGREILAPSVIDLKLRGHAALSAHAAVGHTDRRTVRQQITVPVPEKRRVIADRYNSLRVFFRQPYILEFRAYDDGVAYRLSMAFPDSVVVDSETAEFRFPGHPGAYFPQIHPRPDADIFHTSFEELYPFRPLDSLAASALAYSPVLVVPASAPKIGITESDLEDYPGMFLQGTGGPALRAVFSGYPLEKRVTGGDYPEAVVTRRAPYIARTRGTRSLPWRILIIAPEDRDLPTNDMVYRLAAPSRVPDVSWIKPGKGTDEWIINIDLFDVPFKAGINTATYKYYIDFARRFGFDRIMMDAGWSDPLDLFHINPDLQMDTLAAYAREKGVGLSLWTLALTLDRQLDSALEQFNRWGVNFIMTDFIDRDDQEAVRFYHRLAQACADHHIMIMYHGSPPPRGFNRTYPNALTREGVLGSEYNIWSDKVTPGHDVTLPFTRMLAGAMEYEPGILHNAARGRFRAVEGEVMSQGTRCHQLAMFVVYDSPLQLFSGNPSQGLREPAFMALLGSIPTTWDETRILDARVGAYIVTARQKGKDWFVGGLTDWTPRDMDLPLDFLGDGAYTAQVCQDGINADHHGSDYRITESTVSGDSILHLHMAPGGGFMIRLQKG